MPPASGNPGALNDNPPLRLAPLRNRVEREYLLHHLRRFGGDARALSEFLGYTRKYLYRRLKTLGIRLKEERRRG